jgi:TonB family protein
MVITLCPSDPVSAFPAHSQLPRFLGLIFGFVGPVLIGACAFGAERDIETGQGRLIRFEIPAQPLANAIEAYSAATGIVAAYNGNLAVGRLSGTVKGTFTPEEALRRLLIGNGLIVRYTTQRAFVLVAAPTPIAENNPWAIAFAALSKQNAVERDYSGLVQVGINRSLCLTPETKPGTYRLVIRFWIGASGQVRLVRLLDSTGDAHRDAAIFASLSRASIGAPPPAGMAQPFTMVLLPRSTGAIIDCPSMSGRQNG